MLFWTNHSEMIYLSKVAMAAMFEFEHFLHLFYNEQSQRKTIASPTPLINVSHLDLHI